MRESVCRYADMVEVESIGLEYASCKLRDVKCYFYSDNSYCRIYSENQERLERNKDSE